MEIASDIVERSQSVFLLVRLVVHLVKPGLINEDRLVELKRRVSAYPAELNDFFKHIMDSLGPFYQAQIAIGFSSHYLPVNPFRLSVSRTLMSWSWTPMSPSPRRLTTWP